MGDTLNLDNNQRRNFDEWFQSDDISPQGFFRSISMAAGTGKYRGKEELEPSFIDKFADHFGVQTDRVKELKELSQKQQQLTPLMEKVLQAKVMRMANERYMPKTTGQVPDVMRSLGIEGGQGQPQPFPDNSGSPSASGTPQMNGLMPAPSLGADPAMAGMPLGASSAQAADKQLGLEANPFSYFPGEPGAVRPAGAASMQYGPATLSDGGRLMTPDSSEMAPLPTGPQPGVPGSPNPMNYGSGFDEQGRPVPLQPAPELPIQPIREEPMAMAQRKPMPAPPPADRPLRPDEMMTARLMLNAQASGQLVRDGKGGLIPFHPEAQLLDAGQQGELASIYSGNAPTGKVKLPAAPLMQALKGKQEGKAQDVSQPVREYLKAKDLPQTPENIDLARQAVRDEKLSDEKASIEFKESLQAGSQEVRNFLYSKTGKAFLVKAKPEEVEQAIKDAADKDVSTSARKAMDSFNLGGLDGMEKEKMAGLQQILHVTDRLKNEFTPEERREFVGYFQLPVNRLSQIIQANPRFAKFDALVNREGIAAFETGGKALTAQEAAIIFGFLPNAKEWSPENFEAKLLEADDYGRSKIHTIVQIATTNRRDIGKKMEAAMPKQGASGPATIKGNDDYSKLPSGTLFIGPDGKTRRKP